MSTISSSVSFTDCATFSVRESVELASAGVGFVTFEELACVEAFVDTLAYSVTLAYSEILLYDSARVV